MEKVFVSDAVHQELLKGYKQIELAPEVMGRAGAAITHSKPRKVGKNQFHLYQMDYRMAEAVFALLSECMIEGEVDEKVLPSCEKTLDQLKDIFEVPEEEPRVVEESVIPVAPERGEQPKKKKSPGKKAGGHIPAVWRDWDDEKLYDHLLRNVYISDRAWTEEDEVREKGEKRADFIVRCFEKRLGRSA